MTSLIYRIVKRIYQCLRTRRFIFVLILSGWADDCRATIIGLGSGLFQTVTQLQEQTPPLALKLLLACVYACFTVWLVVWRSLLLRGVR